MSKFFVTVDGKERVVTGLTSASIVVDGVRHEFDIRQLSADRYSVLIKGRSVMVLAGEDTGGQMVSVNGKPIRMEVETDRERLIRELDKRGGGKKGSLEVRAPMPALVGSVLVAKGETVKPGQGLIILEAMKMENEIKAHADGVVKEILVQKGSAVEKNELLISFEEPKE